MVDNAVEGKPADSAREGVKERPETRGIPEASTSSVGREEAEAERRALTEERRALRSPFRGEEAGRR